MKESLQKLCNDFVSNYTEVAKAFMLESSDIYPVCANILCSHGCLPDAEQLKQSRKVNDKHTGVFSNFRGNIRPFLASMLALGNDPEKRMELAKEYYTLLKQEFSGSEYLALAAFILTDLADRQQVQERLTRSKEIYKRMKKEHPFLTSSDDSVFAVLLAFSDKPIDDLIADIEESYSVLKKHFSIGDDLQTVSHVLSLTDGSPQEKAQRLIDLYNALKEAGVEYGNKYQLGALAALSLTDSEIPSLEDDIREVDAFLKEQKGRGLSNIEAKQRAMNAAMIVSDQYMENQVVNTTAMTGTVSMIIAERIAMCITIVSNVVSALFSQNE